MACCLRKNKSNKAPHNQRKKSFCCLVVKIFVLSLVVPSILYSQIKCWPDQPHVYSTNDPNDNERKGVIYTCGCDLPYTTQKEARNSSKNAGLNICYEMDSLEDVQVLMYNANSPAAEKLNPIFNYAFSDNQADTAAVNKTVQGGYIMTQEAHELSRNFSDKLEQRLPELFLNGYRPEDISRSATYLLSDEFTSFPMSFLRLEFAYNCLNCSSCSLEAVNDIFNNVSQHEVWGNCYLRGRARCNVDGWYGAKCTLFPPAALPLNFAVRRFLGLFLELPHVVITDNNTFLQASAPYVNFSRVVSNPIQLSFVEVEKRSALWLSLLSFFPTLEASCSSLQKIDLCNKTSLCNVFTSGNLPVVRNYDMKDSASCKTLTANRQVQFDHAESVWSEFDLDVSKLGESIWREAFCMHKCLKPQVAPYLVTWTLSPDPHILTDSMNQFLYSTILKDFWAHSGVCINFYSNVHRYNPGSAKDASDNASYSGNNQILNRTMFMESNCTNRTANQSNIFCWLTGKYHYLDDTPEDDERRLPDDKFTGPAKRFVCFRLTKQSFIGWMINTVGIVFGWVGTLLLLFQFVEWIYIWILQLSLSFAKWLFKFTRSASGGN